MRALVDSKVHARDLEALNAGFGGTFRALGGGGDIFVRLRYTITVEKPAN